jgi:predicted lipoprotein with Yx(FWY)xxD motif
VASAAGAVLAGLMLAACGSSGPGSSAPQSSPPEATASPAASSPASAPEGGAATVSLKSVKDIEDPTLVGPDGKTVYLFEGDKNGKPTCAGACTQFWPPVTASGMPTAGSGLDKSLLGTVKRADGSTQVTYAGHPLYYYSGDSSPGTALGQAMDAFGAEWYVLNAKGSKIDED